MSRPRLIGLLLALATLLAYLPAAHNDFLYYDDNDYVTDNTVVQKGLTWPGTQWAFTHVVCANWHPLTMMSHMADCELFGLNPGPQHYVNVLFHAASTVLLLLLLLRLTGDLWPSAFVAALFAWHPLHVESVAWIAERKDVLSTFFALLALLAYTRYVQGAKSGRQQATAIASNLPYVTCYKSPYYWLALLFFALGLMAKSMLVTLPFVMLLLDYWPCNRFAAPPPAPAAAGKGDSRKNPFMYWRLILEKIPLLALSGAACVATMVVQKDIIVPAPLALRLSNAVMSYVIYLRQTFCPTGLAVLYPYPRNCPPWWEITLAVVLLAVISAVGILRRRRQPYLLIGWLWYLGVLVPVIGLVQSGLRAHADRYTYLPLVGVFIIVAFGARDLTNRFQFPKIAVAVAASLILAACLILTENQLRCWRNGQTLFTRALMVTKDNGIAHLNLGVAYQNAGSLNAALAEYREAARLSPGDFHVHNNLGSLWNTLGKPEEALAEYRLAVQINPNFPPLHDGIGMVLLKFGRFDEAMSQFAEAARLEPSYPWPYFQMGNALRGQGRDAEAIAKFREALRIDPDNFQILAHAARVLAADEKADVRDGQTALLYAIKANVLSGGAQPFVLDALGMACAETGRFDDAQEAVKRAIKIAAAVGMQKDVTAMQQRLRLYQNHQPWRESFLSTNTPLRDPRKN
jgi:tetratricopeptide (TPR) repeat protein